MPALPSLSSLLAPDRVRVGLEAADKDGVVGEMAALVASAPGVRDAERLAADVRAREAQMSTGVGEGVALPHARTPAVDRTAAAFATLARPVDYAAFDGKPVRLVLLLAGPESERPAHVRLLGRVSRLLADADLRARLLAARTPHAVLGEIERAESLLI